MGIFNKKEKEEKDKKKFKDTKLSAFLNKAKDVAVDKGPDLVGAIGLAMTGNPTAAIGKAITALTSSNADGTNELAEELNRDRELYIEEFELHVRNTESAREMYKTANEQADKIADNIFNKNLIMVLVLVLVNVGIYLIEYFIEMPNGMTVGVTVVSNLITFVIKGLLDERSTVVNFYFGSSMGSKQKSKELENAMQDGSHKR